MAEVITVLAVLGAAGNVILGTALCFILYKRGDVPENRERAEVGKVRIISPYIDNKNKKRGDRR